jgi:hypothetical protein
VNLTGTLLRVYLPENDHDTRSKSGFWGVDEISDIDKAKNSRN